ncbi:PREDICTED: uncharacterized protein LOC108371015 isoform X2 [Rhagoletis zephyria]|uniref:uncharacterized protein LOC108371015 isoform X2 n=2 Tax=Rhagoletis zephyria TaxID=28612 RepID=UPI0008118A02|nr:PREDICTED: uncharacterized protein LOC108371015 isoform X2 [Rhagoletis zephyria]
MYVYNYIPTLNGERLSGLFYAKNRLSHLSLQFQPSNMAKDTAAFKDKSIAEISRKKSGKEYIDIDQTVLEPSPQRIRNILTLEERVAAIEAYDCRPMYTKVAKMFNCSWEQIKNIIANRDAILKFYAATRNVEMPNDTNGQDWRTRKIRFLGECLYEYIQRAQFHTKAHITEELLRMKAFEFRSLIQIDNFMPTKAWMNHFKAMYNFSLSNRQITITRTPPVSLDLKDIMTFCTKNQAKADAKTPPPEPVEDRESDLYRTATRIAVSGENEAALQEIKQRRLRKINFLSKTLFEYWQRARYHHKMRMDENSLRKVACDLKEMLKIDNFYPDKEWLDHYITITVPTMLEESQDARPPPLSLDLKDILSYCSRQENKKLAPSTITLAPKETAKPHWQGDGAAHNASASGTAASATATTPLVQIHTLNLRRSDESAASRTQAPRMPSPKQAAAALAAKIKEEVIELDADEAVKDVKPNLSELLPPPPPPPPSASPTAPPVTKAQLHHQLPAKLTTVTVTATATQIARQQKREHPNHNGSGAQVPALRVVSLSTLVPPPVGPIPAAPAAPSLITAVASPTPAAGDNRKRGNDDQLVELPRPLKIQKIESIGAHVEPTTHSPGHWSEHSDREEEELPRHVTNYKDALKLLKPLEEFAMLEENYRVIGLISQLEEIFKHPPQKNDN